MGHLSVYLPPFSSDYAGACSALFDFNSLITINDAHCCTNNYICYDEPRWNKTTKTTLCTELRTIDAIFGNDQIVISKVVDAAKALNPDFIAVLGSPVPAIIGMDMQGIAKEIEAISGIATFGFNTTGFSYYDKGISDATLALFRRYTGQTDERTPNSVNILGLTPIDYAFADNGASLRLMLQNGGFDVIGSFFMGTTLNQVRSAGKASVNLVVSESGLNVAKLLQHLFKTPYVTASPMGTKHSEYILERLRKATAGMKIGSADTTGRRGKKRHGGALLIVGDQIMASSLRDALRLAGLMKKIDVAGFFGMADELKEINDIQLECEKQLIALLQSGMYDSLIGDPLIYNIPAAKPLAFYALPHPAISGCLFWNEQPLYATSGFDGFIQKIAEDCSAVEIETIRNSEQIIVP